MKHEGIARMPALSHKNQPSVAKTDYAIKRNKIGYSVATSINAIAILKK